MFSTFGRYFIRSVDESPVQVFSILLGCSAFVFPLTILNFRQGIGAKTNQWDKKAMETRVDRWLRLKQEGYKGQ